jgi:hypothetical protein
MLARDDERDQRVLDRWCDAGERGDETAAIACLSAEVELVSPLTEQFRFYGREQIGHLLTEAFTRLDGINYHTRLGGSGQYALFYRATLDGQPLEEAQLLRLDQAGALREITLFFRPLPALTGAMATIVPGMLRRQQRPGLAILVAAATAPLYRLTRLGERRIVPLAAPPKPTGATVTRR